MSNMNTVVGGYNGPYYNDAYVLKPRGKSRSFPRILLT